MASPLTALSRGFRRSYLDYATLSAQLRAWADAFPSIAHLSSIGKTPEGRDIWRMLAASCGLISLSAVGPTALARRHLNGRAAVWR